MKTLIVEDDFVSRKLLHKILGKFGDCDTAVNGLEAVEAFELAHEIGKPYDVIMLDIMLPGIDGHQVLQRVRESEGKKDINGLDGVKIIMTTCLDDKENILSAFKEGCEAYVTKPVETEKIYEQLRKFGLIEA